MPVRLKYVKRPTRTVTAVQLALKTRGFTYQKWGAVQRCKAGDWIVNNEGDVYTVDRSTFRRTYRKVRTGVYLKTTPVWAEVAAAAGRVKKKEGMTNYRRGDYLVFNEKHSGDPYAVAAKDFKAMYKRVS
jgi:cell wall-associated NlpC family hydrolase